MRIRREVVGALCAMLMTACAAAAAGPEDGSGSVPPVVDGVGVLPAPIAPASAGSTPVSEATSTTVPPTTVPATTTTALHAAGNRVLLIGDSILASTSSRYSNDTCTALVPLGWQVEVEAEVSRGIQFGNDVLAQRKKAGWDVGVIFLGTNNGSTEGNEYLKQLNKIIVSLAPSPVVLITISEFRPEIAGINDTIRAIAEVYPDQVSVLDWNQITQASPQLLNEDGIHPTVEGRQVLAQAIAAHLGTAPTSPGACLKSLFTDDSAGSVDGKGGSGSGGTATTVKPRNTPTSVQTGNPTTTVKAGSGSSTTVGGGTPTTSPPPVTSGTVAPPASTTGTVAPPASTTASTVFGA